VLSEHLPDLVDKVNRDIVMKTPISLPLSLFLSLAHMSTCRPHNEMIKKFKYLLSSGNIGISQHQFFQSEPNVMKEIKMIMPS
jgi:hypothetical protein